MATLNRSGIAAPANRPCGRTHSKGSTAPILFDFPVVLSTRLRALHGVFVLGSQVGRVWCSRRAGDPHGVIVVIGDSPVMLTGYFSATQAKQIARALESAAQALELGVGREGGAA